MVRRHSHDGPWQFIDGSVEPGEEIEAAARRHMAKQAGIDTFEIRGAIRPLLWCDGRGQDHENHALVVALAAADMPDSNDVCWLGKYDASVGSHRYFDELDQRVPRGP